MGGTGTDWEFVMLEVPTDDLVEEGDEGEEHKEEVEQQVAKNELGDLDMPHAWSHKL